MYVVKLEAFNGVELHTYEFWSHQNDQALIAGLEIAGIKTEFEVKPMKFVVTQDHIDRGKPRSVTECPIALAIGDQLGTKPFVGGNILWLDENDIDDYTLSNEAQQFILAFDRGGPVEPCELEAYPND